MQTQTAQFKLLFFANPQQIPDEDSPPSTKSKEPIFSMEKIGPAAEKEAVIIELESQIQSLTEKLKGKSIANRAEDKKQLAKHPLGNSLMALQRRLQEARNISRFEFKDDVRKKEWELTNSLFNATAENIEFLLTNAEASLFRVATPAPLQNPEKHDLFTETDQEWQWHVNYITTKRDELKRIIEKLG